MRGVTRIVLAVSASITASGNGAAVNVSDFQGICQIILNSGPTNAGTNTVNGYQCEISNQIAQGDVFFGNFADMLIGMWGGLDLTVDPYSLSKSGGLRIVVFQDVDFVLRRVESFCCGSQSVA